MITATSFKAKYVTVSQVFLQLVVAEDCYLVYSDVIILKISI